MKITTHENTGLIYLKTETPEDHFTLGRITAKFGKAQAFEQAGGQLEACIEKKALIKLLAE